MKNRTVLIVLGIAVVLLAFIMFFERESMTTDELEGRKDRVFVEFRLEAVEGVAIRGTSGQRVELRRNEDPAEDSEKWKIVTPVELEGDAASVRSVLSAIDYLLKDRVVRGDDVAADPTYGLTEPRVIASFTIRGREREFRIGADSQDGKKVYVALDDRPHEFYAVEKEFYESMNLGLDELRDKHLVTGSLSEALAVRVTRANDEIDLAREPGAPWTIAREGARVAATGDQVADLLASLGNLEVAIFVADEVAEKDLARYGLEAPTHSTTVTLPGDRGEVRLLFGKPCDGEHLIHATAADSGTVACVADDTLAMLDWPLARLCEMRAAVFRDEDLSKIAISRGGAELVLERDDDLGRWVLTGADAPEVEQAAVAELLAALRESRAIELSVGGERLAELGDPTAKIALELEAGQESITLTAWASDEPGVQLVRRGEEQAILKIGGKLIELVSVDPLTYRRRTIKNGERDDVVKLSIRGPVSQRLQREGDSWKLVEPIAIAADGASVRELAGLLAQMMVARFDAPAAKPAHGLAEPWVVVTASLVEEKQTEDGKDRTGERQLVVEIGAEAGPGTRYARIRGADGAVFVLGDSYTTAVARPLAARDLLQVDETKLVKIELHLGERVVVAERGSEGWISKDSSISATAVDRLVADLGATKAIRAASFGPPPSTDDTISVRTWTKQQLESDEPATLVIGEVSSDPEERGRFAWRQGLSVTYVLPARIADDVEKLLALDD